MKPAKDVIKLAAHERTAAILMREGVANPLVSLLSGFDAVQTAGAAALANVRS